MQTREIYQVNQSTGESIYAGYAKFSGDRYLGSAGGYGSAQNPANGTRGRGNSGRTSPYGLERQGNNQRNGGSVLGNAIRTVQARQRRRSAR